ncbi:terpenoid synthase-like protein [Phanerochaete sordida]|uniref:Terpenoid synthase-like protein n=1 Tax=Phanerochaete sordida TaxID=48140 RepID=A0A9P3GM83_9APHY|nr:terpenoid synthase-like protein [Phanerochaete sordida]
MAQIQPFPSLAASRDDSASLKIQCPIEQKSVAESLSYLSRHAIDEFLRRTGIAMPPFDASAFGDEVDRLVFAQVATWDAGSANPRRLHAHVVSAINIAKTAYAHTPLRTQVHIALWTALCIFIDDFELDVAAVEAFAARFHAGAPQLHPLLDVLAGLLRAMPDYFHAYGAAGVVTSTVQYITCTLFDKITEEAGLEVHPAAGDYMLYKRVRNGVGEGYGFCIFDKENFPDVSTHIQVIPEAITYLIFVNDLFSFYKEELDGETKNFIHDRARITGKDVESALMDTMEDAVNAVNRSRQILQGEKERRAWNSFLAGYAAFHVISPRYRLEKLFNGAT